MKSKLLICGILLLMACNSNPKKTEFSGPIFGTTYHIKYYNETNYQPQIDSLFQIINHSMSTYIPNSIISKVNTNTDSLVDFHFKKVFQASKQIHHITHGYFEPTIGILVNAWDFGPDNEMKNLDQHKVDSLKQYVDLTKVQLVHDKIIKPKHVFIDFNAIAKGYAVDLIAEFLEHKQIENYLVEIGGEIRAKGQNIEKAHTWKIGIEQPHFDGSQSILKSISLHNSAMATSGTYRKFKVNEKGEKYAHIINPKTGYPSTTNTLSVSVIADDCMTADAYATAFETMPLDSIKAILKLKPELKVFLILDVDNENEAFKEVNLNNFPEH